MTRIPPPRTTGGVAYRVTWRRDTWRPTSGSKSRTFTRRDDAERFLTKLETGLPGLGRVRVRLDHRPVGAWQSGWPT